MRIYRIFALFVSLAWAFSSCQPSYALTLSDIRTDIRRAINDNPSDTSRRRYSDTVLLDYINEAQREIANITWLAERTTSYVLSPLTTYYSLPTDVIAVHQAYFTDISGQLSELDEVLQRSFYDKDPNWDRSAGAPSEYWISHSSQPQGQNSAPLKISYIPIPTYSSTGTVTLWYYSQVPDLSADSDVPFENRRNLYQHHIVIVYHAVSRIKVIEGRMDEAGIYQKFYENSVLLLQSKMGQAPNYNPSSPIPSIRR